MISESGKIPCSTAAAAVSAGKSTNQYTFSRRASICATYAFLIGGMLLSVLPFGISLITSLRTEQDLAAAGPLALPAALTAENYIVLFTEHAFYVPLAVTLQMVGVIVFGQLFTSVLAAYAFARLRFPGREVIFWLYLATLMIPAAILMIPLFSGAAAFGLRNTFAGLVVPFMFGSPYAIFLLRENFRAIPQEILDAAKLDGAGNWRQLFAIVLPMSRPIIVTLLLISIVTQWNSFMWPKIIAPDSAWHVLSVAASALQTQYTANWTLVMSAAAVTILPLLLVFIIFNRQIMRSLGAITSAQ
ncbi:carbohydrate ABC transporter permease [Arcanobacterium hippocoleae]